MACGKEQPSKSILKTENETGPSLGSYNLYAKRASFKDDVIFQQILLDKSGGNVSSPPVVEQHCPIAPDETEQVLSEEERRKREEFKNKRRLLALEGADGLDLKAVLAHRSGSLTEGLEDEEDEEDDDDASTSAEQKTSAGDIPTSSTIGGHIEVVVSDHDSSTEPSSTTQMGDTQTTPQLTPTKSSQQQQQHTS